MSPIRNRKEGSILLYVVFVSIFLLAFFAAFRSDVNSAVAGAVSRLKLGKNLAALSDGIGKIGSDPSSGIEPTGAYAFLSDAYDGRIFTGTAFSGVPIEIGIMASGGALSFETYVAEGAPVSVETFDSAGVSTALQSVAPGTAVEIAYPVSGTGTAVVTSLWGYSVVEIDRFGGKLDYPPIPLKIFQKYGPISKYVGTRLTQ